MTFPKLILAASLNLFGAAAALAQAPATLGQRDGAMASAPVGGGYYNFAAGGSEMLIVPTDSNAGPGTLGYPVQAGRLAAISGNDGDGPQVATLRAAAAAPGRHARLFGGGNEMVIVYGAGE
jgi:hypothetical protein